MHKNRACRRTVSLVLLFALAAPAGIVAEPVGGGRPLNERSAGAGVVVSFNPIKGADNRVIPIPLFVYDTDQFYIRGPQAGWRVFQQDGWQAGIDLRAEFLSWKPGDSPELTGMSRRKMTAEAGATLRYRTGQWEFRSGFFHDVLDNHGGWEAGLSIARRETLGTAWVITPSVNYTFLSAGKANYYFGVRPTEATVTRPAYRPGSSHMFGVSLMAAYRFDDNWTLFINPGISWLDSAIRNSPIVSRRFLPRLITGVTYSW